jgi:DNA repair exonuclease SbcCD nuclease subunit
MPHKPLRFLHAADFHLDQPLTGLDDVPEHLVDLMIDAPYLAARRLFETAMAENVSFVVLSGNLLDLTNPEPRALQFLVDRFAELEQHGITTYWAGGSLDDPRLWPDGLELPEGVCRFSGSEVDERSQFIGDELAGTLRGRSRRSSRELAADDFGEATEQRPVIAVVPGPAQADKLSRQPVDYWALGGEPQRRTLLSEPQAAHYPGTPQGRSPEQIGPHGCTLVECAAEGVERLRFIACDVVRWQEERIMLETAMTHQQLQRACAERVQQLQSQSPGLPLLVTWKLCGAVASTQLHDLHQTRARLAEWLRKQFGHQAEWCWTASVDVDQRTQLPESWFEEDSLLGDYLRVVQDFDGQATGSFTEELPANHPLKEALADELRTTTYRSASHVWQRVAALGADLLRPRESA